MLARLTEPLANLRFDLPNRVVWLISLVICALSLAHAQSLAHETSRAHLHLNPTVEVERDFVTLGDLFSGITTGAANMVLQAPEPGESIELKTHTLLRIARGFNLKWKPADGERTVEIVRLATQIDSGTLERAIVAAFEKKGGKDDRVGVFWRVRMEGHRAEKGYFIPYNSVSNITVKHFRYAKDSQRFAADVRMYDGGPTHRMRGVLEAMVAVPVPIHSIAADEPIRQRDLHTVAMPKEKLAANIQTDIGRIVGKSAKRLLRADRPIAMQYLQDPLLVKRKRLVSVVYAVKNLTLVTKGMALVDGSLGEVVQVKNLKSDRIIEAVVTGHDEVSVSYFGGVASAQ